MRALACALALLCAVGCTQAELDAHDPPVTPPGAKCDPQNPNQTQCGDGTCCNESECYGPDNAGFYCESPWIDPTDPDALAKKQRVRAHR